MRRKYKVVLYCNDDTKPEYVLYADNAEHALHKAIERLPADKVMESHTVEDITDATLV